MHTCMHAYIHICMYVCMYVCNAMHVNLSDYFEMKGHQIKLENHFHVHVKPTKRMHVFCQAKNIKKRYILEIEMRN